MAAAKKAPGKKAPVKKAASASKAPPKRTGVKQAAKKQPASRAAAKVAPAKRTTAKKAAAKAPARKAPVKHVVAKKAPVGTATRDCGEEDVGDQGGHQVGSPVDVDVRNGGQQLPPAEPRGVSKDGIAYTKDFDIKFLKAQRELLDEEKAKLMGQATRLENEANSLIEEAEMGDVQFDDEGGEGDTMVVERERDLALSAQARQTIADIDQALERLAKGTYGYSEASGRPIPRERLEAIPWATELVEEKVGGIGRR